MHARILIAALAIGSAAGGQAMAAPCKDAHGKFIKCPAPPTPTHCKDAHGKFIKCSAKP